MEKSAELDEQECAVLIKVVELKNKLTDMEMQSVYFRGGYDSVGYNEKRAVLTCVDAALNGRRYRKGYVCML